MNRSAEHAADKIENTADEFGRVVASKASATMDQVGKKVGETADKASNVIAAMQDRGERARTSTNEVFGNIREAIEKSARTQPTTTILISAAAGFLIGALWKSAR